jgi:DNA-binding MarR family transcriptional regulator
MIKADRRTIYIELLEEGTMRWRPVEAEYLGNELYRITGVTPDDEV